jgi:hypothetical protein
MDAVRLWTTASGQRLKGAGTTAVHDAEPTLQAFNPTGLFSFQIGLYDVYDVARHREQGTYY